jgi:hypothetical protein
MKSLGKTGSGKMDPFIPKYYSLSHWEFAKSILSGMLRREAFEIDILFKKM